MVVHAAVELEELRRREKEQDMHPDPKIHAFMKVNADYGCRKLDLGQTLSCCCACLWLALNCTLQGSCALR